MLYVYRNKKGRMNQPEEIMGVAPSGYYPVTLIGAELGQDQEISHYSLDFNNGNVTATPIVVTISEEEKAKRLITRKAELAALRYEKEVSGITVGDSVVETDRLSQSMLSGAFIACQLEPTREIDWKGKNGWVKLNASQIAAISAVVANHVQACFTREKELSEALDNEITTDISTGWPG